MIRYQIESFQVLNTIKKIYDKNILRDRLSIQSKSTVDIAIFFCKDLAEENVFKNFETTNATFSSINRNDYVILPAGGSIIIDPAPSNMLFAVNISAAANSFIALA